MLGLFTQVLTGGGLERVGRHTATVLRSWAAGRGLGFRAFSLNDPSGGHEIDVDGMSARIEGFDGRKDRFIAAALATVPVVRYVYCGHASLAPVAMALGLARPRLRYWVHVHGVEVWHSLGGLVRAALRRAHRVVSISRYTADLVTASHGVDPRRIRLLANALDPTLNAASAARVARPRRGSARLLTVARLAASERYKGVDQVLRVLPAILRRVPEARYVVVGDGDDRRRIRDLAEALGVAAHVDLVGRVSEDELIDQYRAADVFVMPSRGEGFGVVFLEAMTFGLPVVAGAYGGVPEVVEEGETGFLVVDEAALAERVARLLGDVELRERMGEAGRRRVQARFTFAHYRRCLLDILDADAPRTGCES